MFDFISMSQENLASYLRDHLAGSMAGIKVVSHLLQAAADPKSRAFLAGLKDDIEADQKELEAIMAQAGIEESGIRKAVGWIAEKAGWSKLMIAGANEGELGWLEGLEALELGISGKRALWKALATSGLPGDFVRLKLRATAQIEAVERYRLRAAKAAIMV